MAQAVLIPIAIAVAGAAVGAGAASLLSPKTQMPQATPIPTRTKAIDAAFNSDTAFRRRQGAAATMLTGPNGAEAPSPGAKALLGQ